MNVRPLLATGLFGLIGAVTLTGCGAVDSVLGSGSATSGTAQTPVAVVASPSGDTGAMPVDADPSVAASGDAPTLGAVPGPFGSGTYGHLRMTITAAQISNVEFDDWGQTGATATDPEARRLFVTIEAVNTDPNDEVSFSDDALTLIAGSRPPVVAHRVQREQGDFAPSVKAQDTAVREYGFDLAAGVGLDQLNLRYGQGTVPLTLPVVSSVAAADPYPVTVPRPAALTFNGALQATCTVSWTVKTDRAAATVDIPKELKGSGAVSNRAPAGSRWLVLDVTVSTGPAKGCAQSPQGVLSEESFRLVIDGRPLSPKVAPLETLLAKQTTTTQVIWQIPRTATSATLRGVGPRGSQADKPFTLPAMPALPGE